MEDILRRLEGEAEYCRAVLSDLEAAIESVRRVIAARHVAEHPESSNASVGSVPLKTVPVKTGPGVTDTGLRNGVNPGHPPVSRSGEVRSLANVSIKDSARYVLANSGNNWSSSEDIAKKAFDLGYRSPKWGDDLERIKLVFHDTMRRDKAFEKAGKSFRLKPAYTSTVIQVRRTSEKSLAEYAAEVIEKAGRPLHMGELMEGVRAAGYEPTQEKTFYNTVYSALHRSKLFEKVETGRWGLKPSAETAAVMAGGKT